VELRLLFGVMEMESSSRSSLSIAADMVNAADDESYKAGRIGGEYGLRCRAAIESDDARVSIRLGTARNIRSSVS
jgi:hypothetical protein